MTLHVAYLVNQYPKVSHTFIRREIAALERQGVTVDRIAVRGWDAEVTDPEDVAEQGRTRYVLQGGAMGLLLSGLLWLLRHPTRAWHGLRLALTLSHRADRPWPMHLVYLLEACRVLRWLQASGARHLHAHFGTNSAEVAALTHALGGPSFSFTVHGPEEFDKPERLQLAAKAARSAFVVAISSFGRSQLWRWLSPDDWHKVQVVHCGLESGFFQTETRLHPSTAARLVCVGRICEQKGQLILVRAAQQLAALGVDFELVLAGDGEMRAQVEHAVQLAGLQRQVRITGWISSAQVKDELLQARALVLPSFGEGLPVVLMEALALGRPVISTYIAGIPELVRSGSEGWLVPAGDVDLLAQAMQQCLQATPEQLARMGMAGHARVLERHAVDAEAAKLRQLFARATGVQP